MDPSIKKISICVTIQFEEDEGPAGVSGMKIDEEGSWFGTRF